MNRCDYCLMYREDASLDVKNNCYVCRACEKKSSGAKRLITFYTAIIEYPEYINDDKFYLYKAPSGLRFANPYDAQIYLNYVIGLNSYQNSQQLKFLIEKHEVEED
jgi:hypothetical protein